MASVFRHQFLPADLKPVAYNNSPLSIGYGQTISQPFIVALMTQLLKPSHTDNILEIGTGSGYQAAVLSALVEHVFTIERIDVLAEKTAVTLKRLGYENITVACKDGKHGWVEEAPFDKIIVTAVAKQIPRSLINQLKVNGHIVMPIGDLDQWLVVATKVAKNDIKIRKVLPVRFVPFV